MRLVVAALFLMFATTSFGQVEPPTKGRGAVVPENLRTVVEAQNMSAGVNSTILKSAQGDTRQRACEPTQPKFDWRDLKKVSAVQDQGTCGSCWAFAAIAAYESSHLIENRMTAEPRPPGTAASEQQALDCSAKAYGCKGGWHDKVFDYLVNQGQAKRSGYAKYSAVKNTCALTASRPYSALTWGFVEGANTPSTEKLKAAICERGPIVAAVNSEGWDARTPDKKHYRYSKLNPQWAQDFPNGVFRGAPSRPNLSASNLQSLDIDHDVLIVGWDDEDKAWIVKNSWGTDWGDGGFIKVAYDTQNLGFNAAWIQAESSVAPVSPAVRTEVKRVDRIIKTDIFGKKFKLKL